MKKEVLLTITGKQKLGGVSDKIELTTVGTLEETSDSYILRYNEEQEPPLSPLKAKLSIAKDEKRVEILRSGSYGSVLIIERSKRNLCNYTTPYGDVLMGIFGKNIENEYEGGEGTFAFGYDIDVNGELTSQNEVFVTVKPN